MRVVVPHRLAGVLVSAPVLRRMAFHLRRLTAGVDRTLVVRVLVALLAFLVGCAVLATVAEHGQPGSDWDDTGSFFHRLEGWLYWTLTTVAGQGDSSRPQTVVGYLVSWLLVLFGVAVVASFTGAVVGFLIDYLLKEGQGMGAAGYHGHVVVCGWNPTARELITELQGDAYRHKIVVVCDSERNPAGPGTYFVRGDVTHAADLQRAGIEEALAAVVCPVDTTNEADLRSILCVMAIKALAPEVRTVVEANNPTHVEHFERAHADEIIVASQLVSRLLARSSLYPGLAGIVSDIVSGGTGSELFRVALPERYLGLTVDELSACLRDHHRATLLSVSRDGRSFTNPPEDFRLQPGDDAVVVAESLQGLEPLQTVPTTPTTPTSPTTTGAP